MKKLPIGIQTFRDIIKNDYTYIDKTSIAYNLIENGKYYFLSRPRRFGKSLFVDTLQSLFQGEKDLFEGLYVYDKWDWERKFPVINISFGGVAKSVGDLKKDIMYILKDNQERLDVSCADLSDTGNCFNELIKLTYNKYNEKVVILVDEYDRPLLDNIDDTETANDIREIIKDLYSQIKDNDRYIRFAFLTGVSKFSKVSIFSGLNNLVDITLDSKYATICGYTQNDLETVFAEHLKGADKELIKEWYDGYNFNGENVYNPFDILLLINSGFIFKNYWFETGTPTFLIKLIKKNRYFLPQLENLKVNNMILESFDIDNIKIEAVLCQTGYLTLKKIVELPFGGLEYELRIPNKEIRLSLNEALIDFLTNDITATQKRTDLYNALINSDMQFLRQSIESLFASIPYNNYVKNNLGEYEGYYASVIYVYLASVGLEIIAEDVTNKGRIDLTLFVRDQRRILRNIYLLEFKVVDKNTSETENSALLQIKERQYHKKYLSGYNYEGLYIVGIEFDGNERNVSSFEWEKIA